ncbi:hypothetical protein ACQ4PT_060305 [Festuca glaucescens]
MTMIPSTSDADFIDVGSNRNISAEYMKRESQLFRGYHNVRSFPDTARSCYTLPSLVPGSKYLVRAMFRYGNYDGLEKLPVFDLYLGVNLWQTVNISQAERTVLAEVISVIPDDSVQGLVLVNRRDMGGKGNYPIRYPYDPYDRAWLPWSDSKVWSNISTKEKIQGNVWNLRYHVPSTVLQTAITALTGSKTIEVSFATQLDNVNPILGSYISGNLKRKFNVTVDGGHSKLQSKLEYLVPDVMYNTEPHECSSRYNITMKAATNSTLPPILNALEYFSVISTTSVGMVIQDGPTRGRNGHGHQQLENRRFTYKELEVITDNFKIVLGQGGFGPVYDGFLQNDTHVAVKLLSLSSNQGIREFLTEAQKLTKIHHKNLVSLVGYCRDGKYLALVYEHMCEANLDDKLRGVLLHLYE